MYIPLNLCRRIHILSSNIIFSLSLCFAVWLIVFIMCLRNHQFYLVLCLIYFAAHVFSLFFFTIFIFIFLLFLISCELILITLITLVILTCYVILVVVLVIFNFVFYLCQHNKPILIMLGCFAHFFLLSIVSDCSESESCFLVLGYLWIVSYVSIWRNNFWR